MKDKECFRVSAGISAVHLDNEFAEWLQDNTSFTFIELLKISGAGRDELTLILNMLIKNRILELMS